MLTEKAKGWVVTLAAMCALQATAKTQVGDVNLSELRGSTMYSFDQVASLSSDDLTKRLTTQQLNSVGGWIVTFNNSAYDVFYIEKSPEFNRVIYSAEFERGSLTHQIVYSQGHERVLTGEALRMAHALKVARLELVHHPQWNSCNSGEFNTVVLPPDKHGTISVYFLTPQIDYNHVPFGGHYRIDVSSKGVVGLARAFSRSCVSLDRLAKDSGMAPSALFISHILDKFPTEIHVFEQLFLGIPLYVGTTRPRQVWKVESGKIKSMTSSTAPLQPSSVVGMPSSRR